jgi:hypothetical protein
MLINVGKLMVSPRERDIYGAGYMTTVRAQKTVGNRPAAIVDAEVRRNLRAGWLGILSHD